ncbi:MAG: glycosyltransferase [Alphaproteobacteria bacterium]|nr:glycosyltransferase [Alphaproteobacteria bacterium]
MNNPADACELSIVMPCLNEARTLAACIGKARSFLEANGIAGEIIVADNGSCDGSPEIAQQAGARLVRVAERGYGAVLAGGIAAAAGVFVIMGDADASYDFAESGVLLEKLRGGADLVMGNRFTGGIKPGAMPFMNRYLGNPVLSAIGRLFFKIPAGDFHCGLRGFKREAVIGLGLRTTGMEYASEMLVRAALQGLKIAEVPVTLSPDGRARPSHLRPWQDGWRHLRFLLLYSPRWLYLYPGLALMGFGIAIAMLLLPGPFMVMENVGIDVHTLLIGAVCIIVGMQSLTFAMLARQSAVRLGVLPDDGKYARLFSVLSVERLLLLALSMAALGVGAIFWAAQIWSAVHFGALDYRDMMRILIAAATLVIGGVQTGFTAFMLGILQIRHKN